MSASGHGTLRTGNASGFHGDRFDAVREMLTDGEPDVPTGDYPADPTTAILGRDRTKDPGLGYARTLPRQLEDTLGPVVERGVALVTNAGVPTLDRPVHGAPPGAPAGGGLRRREPRAGEETGE